MNNLQLEDLKARRKDFGIVAPTEYFLEQQFTKVVRVFIKDNLTFLTEHDRQHYKQLLLDDANDAVDFADSIGLIAVMNLPDLLKEHLTGLVNFDLFKDVFDRAFSMSEKYWLLEFNEAVFNKIIGMVLNSELFAIQ